MSSQAITASLKDAGQTILDTSKNAVRWCGRQVSAIGGFLKDKAIVIWNFIKGLFKNFPHYFNVVKGHVGTFFQDIKNNKALSAGIAGLAIALTLGGVALYSRMGKETV